MAHVTRLEAVVGDRDELRPRVVLYACIAGAEDPAVVMEELDAWVAARGWVVVLRVWDTGPWERPRGERVGWRRVTGMFDSGLAQAVVCPAVTQIASQPRALLELGAWLERHRVVLREVGGAS